MMTRFLVTFLALLSLALAQRPAGTPICDYYAAKVLGNNTESNQKLLSTLLSNTFVVGNYTTPNNGIAVAGFAAPAVYNGTDVTLLPYFTGALNSTNKGGDVGASKLFLDDGGPAPLQKNMSSNGNVTSAQDHLLNHIYQYFGTLLNCSKQGGDIFPAYQGETNMFQVHRFMDLDKYQMDFFINQVALSASSLGFDPPDVAIFKNTLDKLFNTRCAPATVVPGIKAAPELQSICIADTCPLDPKANCAAYPDDGVALVPKNVTAVVNTTTPSSTTSGKSSATAVSAGSSGFRDAASAARLVIRLATLAAVFVV